MWPCTSGTLSGTMEDAKVLLASIQGGGSKLPAPDDQAMLASMEKNGTPLSAGQLIVWLDKDAIRANWREAGSAPS